MRPILPPNPYRPEGLLFATQAAEGLPRRLWTVAEIEAMVEAGIIAEDERFELIDGEFVPKVERSLRHEEVRCSLIELWIKRGAGQFQLASLTPFRLSTFCFLEPDFVFFPSTTKLNDLRPSNILLAVEISDSSLRYDTGRKAKIFAAHGVPELWAIDTETLQTHIFTKPSTEGYLDRRLIEPSEVLVPGFAPEIAVKMGELEMV